MLCWPVSNKSSSSIYHNNNCLCTDTGYTAQHMNTYTDNIDRFDAIDNFYGFFLLVKTRKNKKSKSLDWFYGFVHSHDCILVFSPPRKVVKSGHCKAIVTNIFLYWKTIFLCGILQICCNLIFLVHFLMSSSNKNVKVTINYNHSLISIQSKQSKTEATKRWKEKRNQRPNERKLFQ